GGCLRPRALKKFANDPVEFRRLLDLRHVTAVVDDDFPGSANRPLQPIGAGRTRELVVLAPDDQRRRGDTSDLFLRQAAPLARFLNIFEIANADRSRIGSCSSTIASVTSSL